MKSKMLRGWELLKEIAEGNIEVGTKIKDSEGNEYIKDITIDHFTTKMGEPMINDYTLDDFIYEEFEIIDKQEENTINIQDIEELDVYDILNTHDKTTRKKINEIIQAIRQLDKEIKEKKI